MWKFIRAYIKSMRLYYAFVTGIAGWVGVAYYEFAAAQNSAVITSPTTFKKILILVLLFMSWGINQIVNDYLGLKEDRINAPNRPMVTGKLNAGKALITSAVLLVLSLTSVYIWLEPAAIIPALAGVVLNIVYEYAKGYGFWGNLVFGIMISMCTVTGFLASGPVSGSMLSSTALSLVLMVAVINGLMTFYTFFKDYIGDKAAGKKTIVVKYGLERARKISLTASLIPAAAFIVIYSTEFLNAELNGAFIFLAILVLLLNIWTGILYYRHPSGEKTYYSLSINFRACGCGQAALVALFDRELGMMLFLATYIFIGFLFNLYSDAKA